MAQNLANLIVEPPPVNTTAVTQFTLASFDVASFPAGIGNITDLTIFVRSKVTMFESGGNNYSASWERVATFRRVTTGNPSLVGSVENGNAGTGGLVGDPDASGITLDASGTTIRLRVTPDSTSSRDWYGRLEVMAGQRA